MYPPAKGLAPLVDKNALALLINVVDIVSAPVNAALDVADPAYATLVQLVERLVCTTSSMILLAL